MDIAVPHMAEAVESQPRHILAQRSLRLVDESGHLGNRNRDITGHARETVTAPGFSLLFPDTPQIPALPLTLGNHTVGHPALLHRLFEDCLKLGAEIVQRGRCRHFQ